ncbi:MAG: helix-turn-helix transcriptional regulator [Candidatus Bathyarchaeia archaeon]
MARKNCKGTKLEVFSGKQESLNRVICQILEWKSPLIAYDVWRQLKAIKGFKYIDSKTAYRRMEALEQEGWIVQKGTRQGKRGGDKILYELTLKGKAALRLYEKSLEEFLRTATDEQLLKFIDSFS